MSSRRELHFQLAGLSRVAASPLLSHTAIVKAANRPGTVDRQPPAELLEPSYLDRRSALARRWPQIKWAISIWEGFMVDTGRIWTSDEYQRLMDAADGRRSAIPSEQLTIADLPPDPYAGDEDAILAIIIFAQFYNGYVEISQDTSGPGWRAPLALREAQSAGELQHATLDELRAALFGWQRAHYFQGGWYTEEGEAEDLAWIRLVLGRLRELLPTPSPGPDRP